jgi:hypothetical protein
MARFALLLFRSCAITPYSRYKSVVQFAWCNPNHNQFFCFKGRLVRQVAVLAARCLLCPQRVST